MSTENTIKGIQLVCESSVDPNKCVIYQKCDLTNNIIGKVQGHQALKEQHSSGRWCDEKVENLRGTEIATGVPQIK